MVLPILWGALWARAEMKKLVGNVQTQTLTEHLIPETIRATAPTWLGLPFASSSFLSRASDVALLTLPGAAANGHSVV